MSRTETIISFTEMLNFLNGNIHAINQLKSKENGTELFFSCHK